MKKLEDRMPWDGSTSYLRPSRKRIVTRPVDFLVVKDHFIRRSMEVSTVLGRETSVDVLVPLNESEQQVRALLEQIEKTEVDVHLTLLDDSIQSEEVRQLAEAYQQSHSGTRIIRNEPKIGMVASLNRGLVLSRCAYAAIVMPGLQLPSGWLERLILPMLRDVTVACCYPFTNEIFPAGFPVPGCRLPAEDREDTEYLDTLFSGVRSLYTSIPYGSMACAALNREVVHRIGIFDQQHCKKLTEADVDWALRASAAGFRCVMVENLYVSGTYSEKEINPEKREMTEWEKGDAVKAYRQKTEEIRQQDPLAEIRAYVFGRLAADRSLRRRIVFHQEGNPDADCYLRRYIDTKLKENEAVLTVQYGMNTGRYLGRLEYGRYTADYLFNSLEEVLELGADLRSRRIIVAGMKGFPDVLPALKKIRSYAATQGSRLVTMLVDYYSVCPGGDLWHRGKKEKEDHNCLDREACVACRAPLTQNNSGFSTVSLWRSQWKELLKESQEIFYYSDQLERTVTQVFGQLDQAHRTNRPEPWVEPVRKVRKSTAYTNVLVLGPVGPSMGEGYLEALIRTAEKSRQKLRFYLTGSSPSAKAHKNLKVYDPVSEEHLNSFILRHDIDLILMPEQAPDPLGRKAALAIKLRMPALSLPGGASGELLERYEKGMMLPEKPEQALETIQEAARRYAASPCINPYRVLMVGEGESFPESIRGAEEWLWRHGVRTRRTSLDNAAKYCSMGYHWIILDSLRPGRRMKALCEAAARNGGEVWYFCSEASVPTEKGKSLSEQLKTVSRLCKGFFTPSLPMARTIESLLPEVPVYRFQAMETSLQRLTKKEKEL